MIKKAPMPLCLRAKGYVDSDYLQAAAKLLLPIKEHSYDLMHLKPGDRVLDAGCGLGLDTLALSHRVGPLGSVVGVDNNEEMIAEANRRAEQAGLSSYVFHQLANVTALPLPSNFFDACRSERLLMHLCKAEHAVAEMLRVLKPGGWLVLIEPDWGTLSIALNEIELERRLTRFAAEGFLNNGFAGRQLHGILQQKKLTHLTYEVFPIPVTDLTLIRYLAQLDRVEAQAIAKHIFSTTELDRWLAALAQAARDETLFACVNLILVKGRKPNI
jgi:ubiquinone/menaquinone biosynthesis C-methylase UbiE